jgi:DNA-directed RNA polymerase specialized sigma24 family protein
LADFNILCAGLRPRQIAILYLRTFTSLTYQQIADLLGTCFLQAISQAEKRALISARRRLAGALSPEA